MHFAVLSVTKSDHDCSRREVLGPVEKCVDLVKVNVQRCSLDNNTYVPLTTHLIDCVQTRHKSSAVVWKGSVVTKQVASGVVTGCEDIQALNRVLSSSGAPR